MELLDVFEIGGEHHQRVECGNRTQCVLDQPQELHVVCTSSAIGDGGGNGNRRSLDLLGKAGLLGFRQKFCKSIGGRHDSATHLPNVEIAIIGHESSLFA